MIDDMKEGRICSLLNNVSTSRFNGPEIFNGSSDVAVAICSKLEVTTVCESELGNGLDKRQRNLTPELWDLFLWQWCLGQISNNDQSQLRWIL